MLGFAPLHDLTAGAHGIQRTGYDLRRTGTYGVIAPPGLEQFGVRENDAELIVEPVKERAELLLEGRRARSSSRGCQRYTHACGPGVGALSESEVLEFAVASRHNESAKIRIEPPAVRTYSTLPAEIQL